MQRYFARDQTLTYPLCMMTVTVYHTTFNPFECRRAVLEGVHYETRRTVAVDKTGGTQRGVPAYYPAKDRRAREPHS